MCLSVSSVDETVRRGSCPTCGVLRVRVFFTPQGLADSREHQRGASRPLVSRCEKEGVGALLRTSAHRVRGQGRVGQSQTPGRDGALRRSKPAGSHRVRSAASTPAPLPSFLPFSGRSVHVVWFIVTRDTAGGQSPSPDCRDEHGRWGDTSHCERLLKAQGCRARAGLTCAPALRAEGQDEGLLDPGKSQVLLPYDDRTSKSLSLFPVLEWTRAFVQACFSTSPPVLPWKNPAWSGKGPQLLGEICTSQSLPAPSQEDQCIFLLSDPEIWFQGILERFLSGV